MAVTPWQKKRNPAQQPKPKRSEIAKSKPSPSSKKQDRDKAGRYA